MKDEDLDFTTEERARHKVVKLKGKLILHNVEQFRKEFFELLDQDAKAVLFDLEDLKFVDSSGIGLLIQLQRKMAAAGRDIVLMNLNDHVRQLFQVSGLDRVFKITTEDDLPE